MTPTTIEWSDPPESAQGDRRMTAWEIITGQLRARPGQYARIKVGPRTAMDQTAWNIRRGYYKGSAPAGAFEARVIRLESGEYGIWARYVGDQVDG